MVATLNVGISYLQISAQLFKTSTVGLLLPNWMKVTSREMLNLGPAPLAPSSTCFIWSTKDVLPKNSTRPQGERSSSSTMSRARVLVIVVTDGQLAV